jgi:hypothetical protein
MNVSRIRGFLLQLPKPAKVMLHTSDGEPVELKLQGRSYAKIAETIEARGVELVECFDANGVLLRAMRVATVEAQRSDAAAIPAGIEHDPQALMLTHFANLLHRAYEHSTEIAFTKIVELMDRLGDRSEAIEARLERTEANNRRLHQEQIDDAFERAEEEAARKEAEGGGLVEQLAGAFLGGQANGAAKPNGKADRQHERV